MGNLTSTDNFSLDSPQITWDLRGILYFGLTDEDQGIRQGISIGRPDGLAETRGKGVVAIGNGRLIPAAK
jgi:hypothetical protein